MDVKKKDVNQTVDQFFSRRNTPIKLAFRVRNVNSIMSSHVIVKCLFSCAEQHFIRKASIEVKAYGTQTYRELNQLRRCTFVTGRYVVKQCWYSYATLCHKIPNNVNTPS